MGIVRGKRIGRDLVGLGWRLWSKSLGSMSEYAEAPEYIKIEILYFQYFSVDMAIHLSTISDKAKTKIREAYFKEWFDSIGSLTNTVDCSGLRWDFDRHAMAYSGLFRQGVDALPLGIGSVLREMCGETLSAKSQLWWSTVLPRLFLLTVKEFSPYLREIETDNVIT